MNKFTIFDESWDINKSFLYKEQLVATKPEELYYSYFPADAIRLHHITGATCYSPDGEVSNLKIPEISQYIYLPIQETAKKILLWDRMVEPFLSVGWHFKAALEELTDTLYYQHFQNSANLDKADILITVGYWKRPKNFKGIYVMYDTEALHRSTKQLIEIASEYDHVFLTTLPDVEVLNFLGYKNVQWLPPAASPQWHKPLGKPIQTEAQAVLIGNCSPDLKRQGHNRIDFLVEVAKGASIIYDQVGHSDMYVAALWKGQIALDRSTGYNIGTRPFETICSGRFTLTNQLIEKNKRTGLDLLLVPGLHFAYYEDTPEDCRKQINYWVNREDREELAAQASAFGHKYHSWKQRLSTLLQRI